MTDSSFVSIVKAFNKHNDQKTMNSSPLYLKNFNRLYRNELDNHSDNSHVTTDYNSSKTINKLSCITSNKINKDQLVKLSGITNIVISNKSV